MDNQQVVYNWLARHADEDGFVRAAAGTIALSTGINKKVVTRLITKLELSERIYRLNSQADTNFLAEAPAYAVVELAERAAEQENAL